MVNLFIEFQRMLKGTVPDADLLVPLLIWASGSEKNIQVCQNINKKFFHGNRNIFIVELTLNNMLRHIVSYPKVTKDNEKLKFFYDDICKYFDWTPNELIKNIDTLNIEELKPVIAKAYGYDNKQRRVIKIEGIKYGKRKK